MFVVRENPLVLQGEIVAYDVMVVVQPTLVVEPTSPIKIVDVDDFVKVVVFTETVRHTSS
jgi:hypothetical protein